MGVLVDGTIDFEPQATTPTAPSSGARLWVYEDNQLHVRSVAGGDQVLATESWVSDEVLINRPQGVWFTSETGTPTPEPPSWSNSLYELGDYVIRESDGEVFQYLKPGTAYQLVDQGFSTQGAGGHNAVTNTIARAAIGSAKSLASGQLTVPFDTVSFDAGSHFNTSTYSYVAPVSGYYRASAQVQLASVITAYIRFLVNGSPLYDASEYETSSPNNAVLHINDVVKLNAGDVLAVGIVTSAAASVAANSNSLFAVELIAPLTEAAIQPIRPVGACLTGSQTLAAGATTHAGVAAPGTVLVEQGGVSLVNVTGRGYEVQVSIPGLYRTFYQQTISHPGSTPADSYSTAYGQINGVPPANYGAGYANITTGPSIGYYMTNKLEGFLQMAAGDSFNVYISSSGGHVLGPGFFGVELLQPDQPLTLENGAWQTPTLSSPWTQSGTPVQYMKDALGFVHMRGFMVAPAAESQVPAFTLPAGFRPGINDLYLTMSSYVGNQGFTGVSAAGVVSGYIPGAGNLYVAGTTFLAES